MEQTATVLDPASLLVPGRECGTCTMCCKVFRIPEVEKAAGQWCRHVAQGKGCAIHAARPDVCRTFYCHYLRNGQLGSEWKPAQAKFVLYTEMNGKRLVVATDSAAPVAWRKQPYYAQFKRWAVAGASKGGQILVFNGKRATAVLPDRDQDLGIVDIGDEVIYRPGRGGIQGGIQGGIDVDVRRKAG